MPQAPPSPPPAAPPGAPEALAWGAYLAASWTWCIGMFLPVLLVRDAGPAGFAAFAIPNVLGAAAMGWVLGSRAASDRIMSSHAPAWRTFSCVTLCYHAFFLGWILPRFIPHDASAAVQLGGYSVLLVALVPLALVLTGRRLGAAVTTLGVSALVGLVLLSAGVLRASDWSAWTNGARPADAAWLFPVLAFGFLQCPYLDPTFHHARASLPDRPARLAFGVGFGVFFPLMILLTLAYAPRLGLALRPVSPVAMPPIIAIPLLAHFVTQTVFTASIHVRELTRDRRPPVPVGHLDTRPPASGAPKLLPLLAGTCLAFGLLCAVAPRTGGRDPGEAAYWLFLGCYGTAFPAYVWMFLAPPPCAFTRRSLAVLAAACALAVPMFWMGFVERAPAWLIPGLAVLLLTRAAAGGRAAPRGPSRAPVPAPTHPPRPAGSARAEPESPVA